MRARLQQLLPESFWSDFGKRVREATIRRKRTQKELADHLACTPAHISKMIKTGSVSLQAATAIALYLDVSLDSLIFGPGTKLPRADDPEFLMQFRAWVQAAPPEVREMVGRYKADPTDS